MAPKVAIVGTGAMALVMMSTFAKAGVEVSAVVSRSAERAQNVARWTGRPIGTTDLNSVLERADIDAIYVANRPSEHAAAVIAALRAGKAVLCEKPIATSSSELVAIVEAAAETRTLCMEAIWTQCLPSYRQFLSYARSGRWGTPRSLVATFSYPAAGAELLAFQSPERGGVLLDRGIYLIALAVSLFGEVDRVDAQLSFSDQGVDTEAFLLLGHRSGARSQLATSFDRQMSNTAQLHCSEGLIEIRDPLIGSEAVSTVRSHFRSLTQQKKFPDSLSSRLKARLRQNSQIRQLKRFIDGPKMHRTGFGSDEYLSQAEHFFALLSAKKVESDIVPLSLSIQVMEIIDRAKRMNNR